MADTYMGFYEFQFLIDMIEKYGTASEAARQINLRHEPKVTRQGLLKFLKVRGVMPVLEAKGGGQYHKGHKAKVDNRPVAGGEVNSPDTRRVKLDGKRFVFTAAQNNTYVHEGFFKSLMRFCKHNDAVLKISRFAYNQSGFQNNLKDSEELWYDEKIKTYTFDESAIVCDGLLYCGELDILPTAVDPLSGFASYCGSNSGIFPHTKVAMQSLPRLKGEDARFLYTTGALTLRNYIQRKAGQKAEFHHVYGALYVEIGDDGVWFARQLIADNKGEFYDLTTRYTPGGVRSNQAVAAINWGDVHIEKEDKAVSNASWVFGDSMLHTLSPNYQFVHDLTDFSARNHHNINDPYFLADKYFKNQQSVEEGLNKSSEWLDRVSKYSKVIVVESNHHEAYQRWLRDANIKTDPHNAEFYHESNARLFRAIRCKEDFNIYEWALRKHKELTNVTFLGEDASFVICGGVKGSGIECGIHGHRGINGARGSSKSFRAIGRRVNVGHSHSAGIVDGVYTAGVSAKLDMGYNKGPSSWSHSHIVTYKNGKRAIVTIKNGKWRV
jgi:hypothetical protein